jgi:hypothetical protein
VHLKARLSTTVTAREKNVQTEIWASFPSWGPADAVALTAAAMAFSAAWSHSAAPSPLVHSTSSFSWIGEPILLTNSRVFYSAIYVASGNAVMRVGDDITLQFEDRRSVLPAVARIESLWGTYQLRAAMCVCRAWRISACNCLQLVYLQ